ncbi:DUF934 domain-containing protein [Methylomonas sp. AM2-LC]|uniref:DUF934 domain-containing protein n=1 Tax=Methylomonas sp. AM2-LC TaxID=3153301 RepID=UPI0032651878
MQIIKDKQIVPNDWIYVDNETEIGDQGNITVSLDRWKNHHQQCLNHSGKRGVRLTSTDNVNDLSDTLNSLDLIELDFPGFGDGRIFSQARLLRTRLGYQGEIRATGHFLADQVFYLMRVGVNAFQLENEQQLPLALSCMNDFSVTYQP